MALFENNPQTGAGILSAGSSLLSGIGNIISTGMANKANRELAEYSFDQQKQMIAEQNRYNSPLEQIKRYQEAGLNPGLIYGSGQASAGNQNTIPKYEAPTIQAPDVNLDLTSALQLMLAAKKTEAEINNINASTARYEEDTRSAMLRNNWESFISGKPVEGWNYKDSMKLRGYNLDLQSKDIVNSLNQVRTKLTELNAKERDYFIETLLPLSVELKNLQIQGATYDNVMKAIDASLWRDKRTAEMNTNPWKVFVPMVENFIGTDSGDPVSDAVRKIVRDPLSWKNSPLKWGIDQGKNLFQRFKRK